MKNIDLHNKTVFVTGSAGFIGSNLVLELLRTQEKAMARYLGILEKRIAIEQIPI